MDWYYYVYWLGGIPVGLAIGWLLAKTWWLPRWMISIFAIIIALPVSINFWIDLGAPRGLLETFASIGIGMLIYNERLRRT